MQGYIEIVCQLSFITALKRTPQLQVLTEFDHQPARRIFKKMGGELYATRSDDSQTPRLELARFVAS